MMSKMKAERLRRHWSQTQLAARAALSTSDVSKFESGRMNPYPVQARRLAKALGLRPDELLECADEPQHAA
jgi:transcriptional regulator with XRE-family HTH domain